MWLLNQLCGSVGFVWAWGTAIAALWRGWRDEPSLSQEAAQFRRGRVAVRRTFAVGPSEWERLNEPLRGGFIPVRFVDDTHALFVTTVGHHLRGSLEWSAQAVTVTVRHSWAHAFNRAGVLGLGFGEVVVAAASMRELRGGSASSLTVPVVAFVGALVVERILGRAERKTGEDAIRDLAARFRTNAA